MRPDNAEGMRRDSLRRLALQSTVSRCTPSKAPGRNRAWEMMSLTWFTPQFGWFNPQFVEKQGFSRVVTTAQESNRNSPFGNQTSTTSTDKSVSFGIGEWFNFRERV